MKKEKKYTLITMGIVFIIYIFTLFRNINISLISDDIGSLATPSYLGGRDWHEVIAESSYYGYGFKWIFGIFFKLTSNPYIIYYCIRILSMLLIVLMSGWIYHLQIKYLNAENSIFTVLATCLVTSRYTFTWDSECSLILGFWVLCILTLKLNECDNSREKRIWSCVLGFWSIYIVTLHERANAGVIALCIVLVLYKIFYKKSLVQIPCFVATFLISYIAHYTLKGQLIETFWAARDSAGILANTTAFSGNYTWFLSSLSGWKVVFDGIISNFITIAMKTFGLGLLAIALFAGDSIKLLCKVVKKEEGTNNKVEENMFLMLALSVITSMIVLVALVVSWGHGIWLGGIKNYKSYTYSRYYLAFLWPAITVFLQKLKAKNGLNLKRMIGSSVFIGGSVIYFIKEIWPRLSIAYAENAEVCLNRIIMFNVVNWNLRDIVAINFIVLAIICVMLLIATKKKTVLMLAMAFILLFNMKAKFGTFSWPVVDINCSTYGATYELFNRMEIEDKKLIKNIYSETNYYTCQYMLNDYTVRIGFPYEQEYSNFVILSNNDSLTERYTSGYEYVWCQLDENEYLYVCGLEYREIFERYGVIFQD